MITHEIQKYDKNLTCITFSKIKMGCIILLHICRHMQILISDADMLYILQANI